MPQPLGRRKLKISPRIVIVRLAIAVHQRRQAAGLEHLHHHRSPRSRQPGDDRNRLAAIHGAVIRSCDRQRRRVFLVGSIEPPAEAFLPPWLPPPLRPPLGSRNVFEPAAGFPSQPVVFGRFDLVPELPLVDLGQAPMGGDEIRILRNRHPQRVHRFRGAAEAMKGRAEEKMPLGVEIEKPHRRQGFFGRFLETPPGQQTSAQAQVRRGVVRVQGERLLTTAFHVGPFLHRSA